MVCSVLTAIVTHCSGQSESKNVNVLLRNDFFSGLVNHSFLDVVSVKQKEDRLLFSYYMYVTICTV